MPDWEKVDLNMSKVILKSQKYELQYDFLEIYEYMNVRNGQDWLSGTNTIYSNLFVINIYNSVVWGYQMQNINTNELFPLRNSNYKLATLLLVVLIAYALYTAFHHCVKL